mgnify:CR=1 FL=1
MLIDTGRLDMPILIPVEHGDIVLERARQDSPHKDQLRYTLPAISSGTVAPTSYHAVYSRNRCHSITLPGIRADRVTQQATAVTAHPGLC